MSNAAIRQQLHQYIDCTDDKRIEALYNLLQNDMGPVYTPGADVLNMLHERAEKYMNSNAPTYSVEEAHEKIRLQRKKA